jgi:hypothetical protein
MEGMMVFYQLFPGIGLRETRTATIFGRDKSLPDDSYGFIELYCVDPDCDYRHVMINVLSERRRARARRTSSGPGSTRSAWLRPASRASLNACARQVFDLAAMPAGWKYQR